MGKRAPISLAHRTTKKINMKKSSFWFLPLLLLLAVTLFSGCSNEAKSTEEDDDNAPADARGSLISFQLGTTDYDIIDEDATRAANDNEKGRVVSSSTENLGDGLEALVEVVESPTPKAITRATSNAPAGKYTILAYQNGEQKAKWVLNYNGSTYTMAEGNKEQYLPTGSYKFYVFNDGVTFANDKIVKSLNSNENALYFEDDITIPNTKKHKLSFTLKPVFAKMFFKIKGFSNAAFKNDMSGKFVYDANTIPGTETVDPANRSNSFANNTAAGSVDVGSFTANIADGTKASYIKTNNATYFLPGTDVTKLKFTFNSTAGGQVYGKPVAGKTLSITNAISGNLQAGKSYLVYVTIYYSAKYLFSDGSVGTLMANKGKTPVALVVNENASVGEKIAIALKSLGKTKWAITGAKQNSPNNFKYDISGLRAARDAKKGYDETWNPSQTLNPSNVIKAQNSNFPAFQAVGYYQYAAGSSTEINGKKWYMPGVYEWWLALKYFGIEDATDGYSRTGKGPKKHSWGTSLGYQLVEILFYQVDGDAFDTWYLTADAFGVQSQHKTAMTITLNKDDVHFGGATKTDPSPIRAFIRY